MLVPECSVACQHKRKAVPLNFAHVQNGGHCYFEESVVRIKGKLKIVYASTGVVKSLLFR